MNKFKIAGVSIIAAALTVTGCMTSKVQTVSGSAATGFTTNLVTQVNTNNLLLDASAFQAVVSISVSLLAQKDPSVVAPLKTAHIALDGVLNGSNQMTTQEVLAMLKADGNPALTSEITALVASASALEQNLLAKYGAEVGGQIALALVRAADAGIVVGLAGH